MPSRGVGLLMKMVGIEVQCLWKALYKKEQWNCSNRRTWHLNELIRQPKIVIFSKQKCLSCRAGFFLLPLLLFLEGSFQLSSLADLPVHIVLWLTAWAKKDALLLYWFSASKNSCGRSSEWPNYWNNQESSGVRCQDRGRPLYLSLGRIRRGRITPSSG